MKRTTSLKNDDIIFCHNILLKYYANIWWYKFFGLGRDGSTLQMGEEENAESKKASSFEKSFHISVCEFILCCNIYEISYISVGQYILRITEERGISTSIFSHRTVCDSVI